MVMKTFTNWLSEDFIVEAATEEYGYHVTPTRNLKRILTNGLVPKIGPRSKAMGERHKATYLFKSQEHAHDGVANWLGDHFKDDTPLSLLKVKIPHDAHKGQGADYEHVIHSHIPAHNIAVHTKSM